MKNAGNVLIMILDVIFMLGLVIKVMAGAGEPSDYVGLVILVLLGASYIIPLFTGKKDTDT